MALVRGCLKSVLVLRQRSGAWQPQRRVDPCGQVRQHDAAPLLCARGLPQAAFLAQARKQQVNETLGLWRRSQGALPRRLG